MPRTASSSSSPAAEERLIRIPLSQLHPHPQNANVMSSDRRTKLGANIRRNRRYPPLIVRHHPTIADEYQILDGHQRCGVLQELGETDALCLLWECDDATALVLLTTLNRLEGEDVPAKRAALLQELTSLLAPKDLALLLPESADAIRETLALHQLDSAALLAQLEAAAQRAAGTSPRLVSFAVPPSDEPTVEAAVARALAGLTGPNRRGRALTLICKTYLEGNHD